MNKKKMVILTPIRFYSPEDEELFFNWLDKITCIKSYQGIGQELQVLMYPRTITFDEYRNLYGLFKRYRFKNPEQLKELFETDESKLFSL